MSKLYVIECRKPDGSLDFTAPQPEHFFGVDAITGIDDDRMAKVIFRECGERAVMSGDNIPNWPKLIDARFVARRKTW